MSTLVDVTIRMGYDGDEYPGTLISEKGNAVVVYMADSMLCIRRAFHPKDAEDGIYVPTNKPLAFNLDRPASLQEAKLMLQTGLDLVEAWEASSGDDE